MTANREENRRNSDSGSQALPGRKVEDGEGHF